MQKETARTVPGERVGTLPKCFLHVPKSGGVSVHSALEAALEPGSLAPQRFDTSVFCDFDEFDLLPPKTRSEIVVSRDEVQRLGLYRAVCGHFSLPTLLQITDPQSVATVLREPRARILSLYLYWRTPGIGERWTPYRADAHALRPLTEFLSEPRLASMTDNQVCRMLLQGNPRLPRSQFVATSDVEAIAKEAIDRIDELGFVGVMELGRSSWGGLEHVFGVKLDPVAVNVTGEVMSPVAAPAGETLVTSEALDLIDERSAADLLVYEHVVSRAGLTPSKCQQLKVEAFARELVKMGDLIGHSAVQAAGLIGIISALRSQLDQHERCHGELIETRERLHAQELMRDELDAEVDRQRQEIERALEVLDAVCESTSWRITTPLRTVKGSLKRLIAFVGRP